MSLLVAEAPLSGTLLDLVFWGEPQHRGTSNLHTQLAAARECMQKSPGRQARNLARKTLTSLGQLQRIGTSGFARSPKSAGGRAAQEVRLDLCWALAVRSPVNQLANIVDLPLPLVFIVPLMLVLKQLSESPRFSRLLPIKCQQCRCEGLQGEDTEIVDT